MEEDDWAGMGVNAMTTKPVHCKDVTHREASWCSWVQKTNIYAKHLKWNGQGGGESC